MSFIKSIIAAFSLFSRIPMPITDWDEKTMRYLMGAFPLVGVVLGALQAAWCLICMHFGLAPFSFAVGIIVLSVLITGGIHIDGFCDVVDALSSHAPAEKKRAILKDPHVGAFAVIGAVTYLLALTAILNEMTLSPRTAMLLLLIPIWSRTCSGITVILFPKSASEGMLSMFKQSADKRPTLIILLIWFAACLGFALYVQPICAGAMAAILALCTYALHRTAMRQFGGMSGDLSGFYLQLCECGLALCLALTGGI